MAATIVGLVLAVVVIPKRYTSEAMMYVENSADKSCNAALNINDINVAQKIVNTCPMLFTGNQVLEELRTDFDDFSSENFMRSFHSFLGSISSEITPIFVHAERYLSFTDKKQPV